MKFKHFSTEVETQTIYLDKKGSLQASCDSIFSTKGWKTDTIFNHFPLLRSIFTRLASLKIDQQPIHIPKVESATGLPPGFYDFSFSCLQVDGEDLIRWVIYDYTQKYSHLQKEQQSQHSAFIAKDKKFNC